jgi:SAM-dependent methyltransferase
MADLSYHFAWIHSVMLRDRRRCEVYQQALARAVAPGAVVLDVGAGTGILSLFAAQAGAGKVYAVECTSISAFARELVAANGYQDVIEVISGRMEEVQLPERVDVIVSEWMGCLGVDENILPAVIRARDRYLKPGGVMLPAWVRSWIAPLADRVTDDELAFWRSRPYGLDLAILARTRTEQPDYTRPDIDATALIDAGQPLWTADAYRYSEAQARSPYRGTATFHAERDDAVSGIAGWFDAGFGDAAELDTSPASPRTCWGQLVLPFRAPIAVRRGTAITIAFSCTPIGPGYSVYEAEVSVGRGPRSRSVWKYEGALQA